MAGTLKDQLLKAGLVSTKQVRQAQHQQRKTRGTGQPAEPGHEAAQRAQAQKAERDRELNRQRQEEAARKEVAAQIKQLIETNRLPRAEGDIPYNFIDGTRIKRIYVTPEIQAQLVKGSLCIAKLGGRHELVRRDVAEKIHARDPKRVIIPTVDPEPPATTADDPYAAYQVPDDLMW